MPAGVLCTLAYTYVVRYISTVLDSAIPSFLIPVFPPQKGSSDQMYYASILSRRPLPRCLPGSSTMPHRCGLFPPVFSSVPAPGMTWLRPEVLGPWLRCPSSGCYWSPLTALTIAVYHRHTTARQKHFTGLFLRSGHPTLQYGTRIWGEGRAGGWRISSSARSTPSAFSHEPGSHFFQPS